MTRIAAPGRALLLATLLSGSVACDTDRPQNLVAEAEAHTLTVDETLQLLAARPELPPQEDVVRAVANLWVDYILLAEAAAEDSLLSAVDLTPLLEQQIHQQMILQLRDSVIQVDTALTEEQLRSRFMREAPGAEVRARHILLTYPQGASDEQRDSVRALARDLADRIRGGGDFAALARQHSRDPGSGQQGGDLGWFGRGQMVPPFEEAAFSLAPGEVSDPVETPYGVHVIQVQERRAPDFDSVADMYRQRVQSRLFVEAESVYVSGLEGPAEVEVREGAVEVVRQIAERPGSRLSRRAAARPLVEYRGGTFTVREFQAIAQNLPPGTRGSFQNASDEQIEDFLRSLTRTELLVAEARSRGFEVPQEEQDSLERTARERFLEAVGGLGLRTVTAEPGEERGQAIERIVKRDIREILGGERDVLPLGALAYQLRRRYDANIYDAGVDSAVVRLEAAQAELERRSRDVPSLPDSLLVAPPDTGGGGGP